MTDLSLPAARQGHWVTPFFAAMVLASAGLVFMVEPMIARMILPQLGGSSAVWNVSVAFFQTALLAGYVYAHLLQRLRSLTVQVAVHLMLLAAATLVLPIGITTAFGPAPVQNPTEWLLEVLVVSIGAPFAALSATAPLLQAWYARLLHDDPRAENPYVLYAASNLGSMLALLAYPIAVEPLLTLHAQAIDWTLGFCLFCALVAALGLIVLNQAAPASRTAARAPAALNWRTRLCGWRSRPRRRASCSAPRRTSRTMWRRSRFCGWFRSRCIF